jgi:hypothetical protein
MRQTYNGDRVESKQTADPHGSIFKMAKDSGVFREGGAFRRPPPRSGKFFLLWEVAEPPVKRYLGGPVVRPPPVWCDQWRI